LFHLIHPAMNFETKVRNWVIATAAVVVVLWLVTPLVLLRYYNSSTDRGTFGDMYGVATSLFTGFTIIGLIYTILLQQEDIRIARAAFEKQIEELELNRKNVELNTKELKANRDQIRWQRFDNTFFNLIELHLHIVRELQKEFISFYTNYIHQETFKGLSMYHMLRNRYNENRETGANGPTSICRLADEQFGQYLRNFEFIIDYIDTGKDLPENRARYFRIYFAQLSIYERRFLFYHLNLRESDPPPAFQEYKDLLFQPLFTSTSLPHYHYIPIFQGGTDFHTGRSK
jgi:hypothetical protein